MKHSKKSNQPNDILAHGGGNATAAGVEFQAKLGAWFASQLLAERPLDSRLTGKRLRSLRFETEAPVDDILVETDEGWIFIQAKTSLTLSVTPKSELVKTVDQFVRQWHACSAGDGGLGWNRPLRPDRDRIVLVMGPDTSRSLSVDLAQGIAKLQKDSSAPLPKSKTSAVEKFNSLIEQAWRSVTGRPASTADINAILNLVTILTFDFDGADRRTATEILSHVLNKPEQAGATFSTLAQYCLQLMRQRTGCDMPELRRALMAEGVSLTAPPSYRKDVDKLRAYSEHVRRQLSDYEATNVAGQQVCIERQCTDAIVNAARVGSLLLVGEPGSGKSAVINASAAKLKGEGHDVFEIAVDHLPVKSLPELSAELGLSHPLRDVLLNWPGDQPAFLFIDALDATRGGENGSVFRTFMADVLSFETRQWHVIASIRTFDLRLGEQFKDLFRGRPPNEEYADAAFPGVAHIHVPPWTSAELGQLLREAPMLAEAINAGGERLRELAQVPFNTRLLADLISSGLAPAAFGEIQSQVQLLSLYWNKRVEKHGTGADLCIEATVTQMIESRSLRVRKLDAARPDASAFDALLHENVLVLLNQGQFVAFRHHILFDYAASHVYLRVDKLDQTAYLLTHGKGLGLMLAPALGYALQQLWNDVEDGHRNFWEAITRFSGDPAFDPVTRSVAARTASELPYICGDAIGLLAGLSEQGEPKKQSATALSHVVGALVVRFEDKQPVSLDPWCELSEQASQCIEDTAWPLRTLIYELHERIGSEVQQEQLGRAARKLLAYSLDSSNAAIQLTASAIGFVSATYASDIDASRQLLRRLFEPAHFQDHADQEIPWLARKIEPICDVDPDFVIEIYAGAFGAIISDRSTTSMGHSQIMALSSNRRQDYDSALWSLKEFFPHFLKTNSVHAVRALIQAISGYVARAHQISEDARAWSIQTPAGIVRLQEDRSNIWAWDINEQHSDNALSLVKAFVTYLEEAEPHVARAMVQEIVAQNDLGLLWSRTLMVASKRAGALGDLLWSIATQEPFLTSPDTQKDAIDFIAARYSFENITSREVFEETTMGFQFEKDRLPDEARQRFLEKLFSCVGEQNLATNDTRSFITDKEADGPSNLHNKRPFSIVTRAGSPKRWWWLESEDVDLNDPEVLKILNETDGSKKHLGLENGKGEVTDIDTAISRVNALMDMAASWVGKLHGSLISYVYGIAAQGTTKLSKLPLERLRENDRTIPSLITLVIRLSEVPAEPASADEEARFESSTSWGSPNTPVDTAEAVMHLCWIGGDIVEKLRPTMEKLLCIPIPAARMQIADGLSVLWDSSRPLMWELADRLARTEHNRGVLRSFASYFLGHTIHDDPERVEQLTYILYKRNFDRTQEPTKSLFEQIGGLIGLLWITHGRPKPWQTLQSWINDPHTYRAELKHAIAISRNALVLKYQKEDPVYADITQRAQEFCRMGVTAMANGLECYLDEAEKREAQQQPLTETEREHGTLFAKFLNQLCDEIYFASGAFRSGKPEDFPLEADKAKRGFLSDMQPLLARIADAGTPSTIHHLIELLDFLVPADPVAVFDLVANALLGAGRRHGYQFESLGAGRFVEIVGHYLADYRELFVDENRRQKLVTCLDTFMEAGWPSARRLLYRLPELLQ